MVGQTPKPRQPLTHRQRWTITVPGLVLLGGVVIGAAWSTGHPGSFGTSSHGCVSVTVPGVTGADVLHRCGADARRWCSQELARPDSNAAAVLAECRKVGLAP